MPLERRGSQSIQRRESDKFKQRDLETTSIVNSLLARSDVRC